MDCQKNVFELRTCDYLSERNAPVSAMSVVIL